MDDESEIVIPEAKWIPNTPSIADYLKHQVTHYPFQDWCPICVKVMGRDTGHFQDDGKDRPLLEYRLFDCQG